MCVGGNALTWPGASFWGYAFPDLRLESVCVCVFFVAVGADAGADAADVRDEFGLVAAPLTYTISFGLACTVFPHPFLKCF